MLNVLQYKKYIGYMDTLVHVEPINNLAKWNSDWKDFLDRWNKNEVQIWFCNVVEICQLSKGPHHEE